TLRIAACLDPAGVGIHDGVLEHVGKAATLLAAAGYPVESADPPDLAAAAEAWNTLAQGESRLTLFPQIMEYGDAASRRAFQLMLNRTPELDVRLLMHTIASRATLLRRWQLFMERYPLVLCPLAMEPALPYGVDTDSDASVERLYRSHI